MRDFKAMKKQYELVQMGLIKLNIKENELV